ncbi:endonuclease III [bacterium BMS3Abin10]|nr:endonuclease III [bacterium BMS3Abin10]GBE37610.1 endonuclease III [bacterium BMS3Bbin08]
MSEVKIKNHLLDHGRKLFKAKKTFSDFTGIKEADVLLNDIDNYPHAFVIGCVMDRQMRAELAWAIPYRFLEKLDHFDLPKLAKLSQSQVYKLMTKPEPLHRFPDEMSNNFHQAIKKIKNEYKGDASIIWNNTPSSAEVVYRFMQFRGVGPKIATMAANILARDFKIKFSDYYSIDISVDVHVRRVFRRLGLVPDKVSTDELIYKARALYPDFPGLMDLPAWEIGRNWCKPKQPLCDDCYMGKLCPSN